MSNPEVWLWILLVMLPHNSRTNELLRMYGSALDAARAMRDGNCPLLTEQEKKRVQTTRTRDVRQLIEQCEKQDIRMITLDDAEYPVSLKAIADPPIVLFVKGSLSALSNAPSLAVVGPRSPSEYGRSVTSRLCTSLSEKGVVLISGLAVGIDAAAHRAATGSGGKTIGVLGCGINVNYPAENHELKEEIVAKGGAVISELLPNTAVSAAYFRQRNRIISGLAMGTLVIEAPPQSGSLLTAAHSFEQGRCVLAIPPHDVTEERFRGVFPLFRKGAACVGNVHDIFSELVAHYEGEPLFAAALSAIRAAGVEPSPVSRKRPARKTAAKEKTPVESAPEAKTSTTEKAPEVSAPEAEIPQYNAPVTSGLGEKYDVVANLLRKEPLTTDELIERSEIPHNELCGILLELELSDLIIRNQDATYSLK